MHPPTRRLISVAALLLLSLPASGQRARTPEVDPDSPGGPAAHPSPPAARPSGEKKAAKKDAAKKADKKSEAKKGAEKK